MEHEIGNESYFLEGSGFGRDEGLYCSYKKINLGGYFYNSPDSI